MTETFTNTRNLMLYLVPTLPKSWLFVLYYSQLMHKQGSLNFDAYALAPAIQVTYRRSFGFKSECNVAAATPGPLFVLFLFGASVM